MTSPQNETLKHSWGVCLGGVLRATLSTWGGVIEKIADMKEEKGREEEDCAPRPPAIHSPLVTPIILPEEQRRSGHGAVLFYSGFSFVFPA